jgi:hypothetical protein
MFSMAASRSHIRSNGLGRADHSEIGAPLGGHSNERIQRRFRG